MGPRTRYAKSGGTHIAYQVVGSGEIDLVLSTPWVSNIEIYWEEPLTARMFEQLAAFSRLVLVDKRGTGSSDRGVPLPILEEQTDDLAAVMDDLGIERAALLGMSKGGTQCAAFAAAHPERTRALVLFGAIATNRWRPETPWAPTDEIFEAWLRNVEKQWGGPIGLNLFAPSIARDPKVRDWWARLLRLAASPHEAVMLLRMLRDVDVRHLLPSIQAPTLVLQRAGDLVVNVENGRYLGRSIPGARYVELPGNDHFAFAGDTEGVVAEIREFLTGARDPLDTDRVLATVLFTDIVGSTQHAVELGDRRWRDLLARHHRSVREELVRFRGREVDTAGDGFFATFDGPARAIRCGRAIVESVERLGLTLRVGLHTGECERIGEKVGGIAVHTAARVVGEASPGEVLVSSTVRDLVAGSGLHFEDRGVHPLRGIPGEWRLFAATR